jgi:hypothetical protein
MAPFWHVAFAVPDLEQGMHELGEAFLVGWRPLHTAEVRFTDEDAEEHELEVTYTFSEGGPPSIEIWQAIPDTPMGQHGDTWLHHIGYWVEDLDAEGERLAQHGWPCFTRAHNVRMHRGPGGILLEPCDVNRDRPFCRDLFPPGSKHHGPPDNNAPKFFRLGA